MAATEQWAQCSSLSEKSRFQSFGATKGASSKKTETVLHKTTQLCAHIWKVFHSRCQRTSRIQVYSHFRVYITDCLTLLTKRRVQNVGPSFFEKCMSKQISCHHLGLAESVG